MAGLKDKRGFIDKDRLDLSERQAVEYWMKRWGVTREQLTEKRHDARFAALMREMVAVVRRRYDDAAPGTPAVVVPPKRARRKRGPAADYPHDPLFERLRERRRALASEAGVPPYVIFHDSTLREMAELKPASLGALSRISGVGTAKLERYGQAFVEVISSHE